MKLIDTDEDDPSAHPEPPVRPTPPRPEKRKAMVSLLFTVTVLVGTVVAVFTIFPERHNEIVTSTVNAHRKPEPWDVVNPDDATLAMWARAVLGDAPPLPAPGPDLVPIGGHDLAILGRRAALIRYRLGGDEVTFLVQRARDIPKRRERRTDGEEEVENWRNGPWTCVAVGPSRSAALWRPRLGVP
jgi:hypothetical protein